MGRILPWTCQGGKTILPSGHKKIPAVSGDVEGWAKPYLAGEGTLRRSAPLLGVPGGVSSVADQRIDIGVEQRQLIDRQPGPDFINAWHYCFHHTRLLLFRFLFFTHF